MVLLLPKHKAGVLTECIASGVPSFGTPSPGMMSPQDCNQIGRNGGGDQAVSSSTFEFSGGLTSRPSLTTEASEQKRGTCAKKWVRF